jgi:hypothetical protein
VGESGKDFAKRVIDNQFGPGAHENRKKEFSELKKWADRSFKDPAKGK